MATSKGARSERPKGRGAARYAGIPHAVLKSPDYVALPPGPRALLLELAMQYNGCNNGDLSAAFSVMRDRGLTTSKTTLAKWLSALLDANLIELTRHPQFTNPGARCALYALTWQPRDECPGKDLLAGKTTTPLRQFSVEAARKRAPPDHCETPPPTKLLH